jgi:hypothetical protein
MKKSHDMSFISPWFEEEMELERRIEYRAPSPIIFGIPLLYQLGWNAVLDLRKTENIVLWRVTA